MIVGNKNVVEGEIDGKYIPLKDGTPGDICYPYKISTIIKKIQPIPYEADEYKPCSE